MKSKFILRAIAVITFATLIGCSSEEEKKQKEEMKKPAITVESLNIPSLNDVVFTQKGNSVEIKFDVEDLKLSKENAGKDHIEGEGHVHVYIGKEKITELYDEESYLVRDIPSGKHKIKISLHQNNHVKYDIYEEFGLTIEKPKE